MDASIKGIFAKNAHYGTLYAYTSAVEFYKKLGFFETQKWNFYIVKAR